MTPDALAAAVRAAGYFAQVRLFGPLTGVEAAHPGPEPDRPEAPLVRAVQTRAGRWALTVFGAPAVGVPDPAALPSVVIDLLREMGHCLDLPGAVIERYGLTPFDPTELATGDH